MRIYIIFKEENPVVVNEHMSLFENKDLATWFVGELAREEARKVLSKFGKDWMNPKNIEVYSDIVNKEYEKYSVIEFTKS